MQLFVEERGDACGPHAIEIRGAGPEGDAVHDVRDDAIVRRRAVSGRRLGMRCGDAGRGAKREHETAPTQSGHGPPISLWNDDA